MMQEVIEFYNLIEYDSRVKAVVIMGAGDKAFCAGADLEIGFLGGASKSGSSGSKVERDVDHRDGGGKASLAIHNCSKPTVAAINGAAVGVGITMTLPCAIRVACAPAKVGFVFSQRGIVRFLSFHSEPSSRTNTLTRSWKPSPPSSSPG
jgi:enoyl-CoA hydratase/carnithine racemase